MKRNQVIQKMALVMVILMTISLIGIINLLETVKIQEYYRQPALITRGIGHGNHQPVIKKAAVGKTGQTVMIGQIFCFFRFLAAFCNIFFQNNKMINDAIFILMMENPPSTAERQAAQI